MKRKFLVTLAAFLMAAICAVSMAACDNFGGTESGSDNGTDSGTDSGTDTSTATTKGEEVTAEQWKNCITATLQAKNFTYEIKYESIKIFDGCGDINTETGKVIADMENNIAYECAEEIEMDGNGVETYYHSDEVYYQVKNPDLIMCEKHINGRETDEDYRVDDWCEYKYEKCPQHYIERPYSYSNDITGAVFSEFDGFIAILGENLEDAYDMFTYNAETGEYLSEVDELNGYITISFKFNNGYITYFATYNEDKYEIIDFKRNFSDYGTSKITVPQEVKDLMDNSLGGSDSETDSGSDTPTDETEDKKITATQWEEYVTATLQAKNFTYEVINEMKYNGETLTESGKVISDMDNNMAYIRGEKVEGKELGYSSYEVYYQVKNQGLVECLKEINGKETEENYEAGDWEISLKTDCSKDLLERPYQYRGGFVEIVFMLIEDLKQDIGKNLEDAYNLFMYNAEKDEYSYEIDLGDAQETISFKFNNGYISYMSLYFESEYIVDFKCTFSDYGTSKITVPQEVKDLMDKK